MKITTEHYTHIKDAISRFVVNCGQSVTLHIDNLRTDKRVKDINKRLRWDLSYACGLNVWICDNIYTYANDDHLDTALRQIMRELNIIA